MIYKGYTFWQMLVKKEFLVLYRNKTIIISAVAICVLFVVAITCTLMDYQTSHQERKAANQLFRKQWEHQQRNPHDAAHFGTYLFKPINLLNIFDTGLNDYTGNTYRIEAHIQHEPDSANAENLDASMRFGRLTPALILQLLIPLFILFITATSITAERENGTLKMLMVQGLSPSKLVWAKVISGYFIIMVLVLPVFLLMMAALLLSPDTSILLPRFLWIVVGFSLYFFLITLLGTIISAISGYSGKALLTALSCWILMSIVLPKLLTGMADRKYPQMSRAAFTELVEQGYRKGIKGNDPYAIRGQRYVKDMLKKYHVDTTSALPFNIEGLTFQYNEDYRTMVFNHYLSQVEESFHKQQNLLTIAGLFDPFLSVKRYSMALAGTDFYHQQNFFKQAQTYRNQLIRQLNMQLAMHGQQAAGGYTVGPQYFAQLKDFHNTLPGVATILARQKVALLSLFSWIISLSIVLQIIASRSLALHNETA